LPLKDNSVDLILGFDLIQHLKDSEFQEALKEINRVLKSAGIFITSSPNQKKKKVNEIIAQFFKHVTVLIQRPLLGFQITAPKEDKPLILLDHLADKRDTSLDETLIIASHEYLHLAQDIYIKFPFLSREERISSELSSLKKKISSLSDLLNQSQEDLLKKEKLIKRIEREKQAFIERLKKYKEDERKILEEKQKDHFLIRELKEEISKKEEILREIKDEISQETTKVKEYVKKEEEASLKLKRAQEALKQIELLQAELATKEKRERLLVARLNQRDHDIIELLEEMKAKEEEIEKTKAQLKESTDAQIKRDVEVISLKREIEELKKEIEKKGSEIWELKDEASRHAARFAASLAASEKREEEIQEILAKKEETIRRLTQKLKEMKAKKKKTEL
jgi:SAM-dependent methyltransferase